MSKKEESTRSNYATDRLNLSEVGPGRMSKILLTHMDVMPDKAIMMIGEPGIGKTMITNKLEKTGRHHVLTIRLVNEDEGTMIGYADPNGSEDTVILRVIKRVKEGVQLAIRNGQRLVVFFDEVNRAKEHMIKCVFNIIDTKRWGDLHLPENTSFVAAINPPTANHKVRDVLSDAALRRRFVVYAVKADVLEYLTYATEAKIHVGVTSFLRSKPDCLYDYHSMDNGFPYACPASWDTVGDVLSWYERSSGDKVHNIHNSPYVMHMLAGLIGTGMTHQLMDYFSTYNQRLKPEMILKNYAECKHFVEHALSTEFTKEDGDVNSSTLTSAATELGVYVANQIAHEKMFLHLSQSEAEEANLTAKERAQQNLEGHNLSKFLNDCPASILQSFVSSVQHELKEINSDVTKVNAGLGVLSNLSAYPEYVTATTRYTDVTVDRS